MRILGILLGIALVSLSATPALASFDFRNRTQEQSTIRNMAHVSSSISTGAFTGGNTQINGIDLSKAGADDLKNMSTNTLQTGLATNNTTSRLLVNTNTGCGCNTNYRTSSNQSNFAMVNAELTTQADSGANAQQNGISIDRAHVDDVFSTSNNHLTTGSATNNTTSLMLVNVQWNGTL